MNEKVNKLRKKENTSYLSFFFNEHLSQRLWIENKINQSYNTLIIDIRVISDSYLAGSGVALPF